MWRVAPNKVAPVGLVDPYNADELPSLKNGIRGIEFPPPVSSVTRKSAVVKLFSWGGPVNREMMMREVVPDLPI